MDIASLNAFLAVARDSSFSKASHRLHITQPAVSKRVASLEQELGVALFNRVAKVVSLTEAGKQLLPKARDLVNQATELHKIATNLSDEIKGNLSVSIAHHIGLYRMQAILREFNLSYPLVNLDIRFEDSEQAFASVEQGDIEFGVITLPKNLPSNIGAEVIWRDELRVVVANDHPLAAQAVCQVKDLANYRCVLPTKETETHQIMNRLFEKHQLELTTHIETNSLETLKMMVGARLGWSLLPTSMLTNQDLAILPIEEELSRKLGLVFHNKRTSSNAANALKELIRLSASIT